MYNKYGKSLFRVAMSNEQASTLAPMKQVMLSSPVVPDIQPKKESRIIGGMAGFMNKILQGKARNSTSVLLQKADLVLKFSNGKHTPIYLDFSHQ